MTADRIRMKSMFYRFKVFVLIAYSSTLTSKRKLLKDLLLLTSYYLHIYKKKLKMTYTFGAKVGTFKLISVQKQTFELHVYFKNKRKKEGSCCDMDQ